MSQKLIIPFLLAKNINRNLGIQLIELKIEMFSSRTYPVSSSEMPSQTFECISIHTTKFVRNRLRSTILFLRNILQ